MAGALGMLERARLANETLLADQAAQSKLGRVGKLTQPVLLSDEAVSLYHRDVDRVRIED